MVNRSIDSPCLYYISSVFSTPWSPVIVLYVLLTQALRWCSSSESLACAHAASSSTAPRAMLAVEHLPFLQYLLRLTQQQEAANYEIESSLQLWCKVHSGTL